MERLIAEGHEWDGGYCISKREPCKSPMGEPSTGKMIHEMKLGTWKAFLLLYSSHVLVRRGRAVPQSRTQLSISDSLSLSLAAGRMWLVR